mgnify:CR=1 FL=1
MLGDLNARVGIYLVLHGMEKYGTMARNDVREKLLGMCLEREKIIENSFFRKKRINKLTWQSIGTTIESL